MSLESDLQALTRAVLTLNSNLSGLLGLTQGGTPAPAPEPQEPPRTGALKTPEEAIEGLLEPTKADVIAALKALQEVSGSPGVKALLDEHGVRNVGGLPQESYGRVIEQARALVRALVS